MAQVGPDSRGVEMAKRINGKFAPGHSGNPGGRPRLTEPQRRARLMLSDRPDELVQVMFEAMEHCRQQAMSKVLKPADELAYLQEATRLAHRLYEMGCGRAPDAETALELARIAQDEHHSAVLAGDPRAFETSLRRLLEHNPELRRVIDQLSQETPPSLAPSDEDE